MLLVGVCVCSPLTMRRHASPPHTHTTFFGIRAATTFLKDQNPHHENRSKHTPNIWNIAKMDARINPKSEKVWKMIWESIPKSIRKKLLGPARKVSG